MPTAMRASVLFLALTGTLGSVRADDPKWVKAKDSGSIFKVVRAPDGRLMRRHVPDRATFDKLGGVDKDVKEVSERELLKDFKLGDPWPIFYEKLVTENDQKDSILYVVRGEVRYPVPDSQTAIRMGIDGSLVKKEDVSRYTLGQNLRSYAKYGVWRSNSSTTCYFIDEENMYREFPDDTTVTSMGIGFNLISDEAMAKLLKERAVGRRLASTKN